MKVSDLKSIAPKIKLYQRFKELNPDAHIAITGSTLLNILGFETRRESKDLDLLFNVRIFNNLNIPDEWEPVVAFDVYPCAKFFDRKTGIYIDIIYSTEKRKYIVFPLVDEDKTVPVELSIGSVYTLLLNKASYSIHDREDDSQQKHFKDLEFLAKYGEVSVIFKHLAGCGAELRAVFEKILK